MVMETGIVTNIQEDKMLEIAIVTGWGLGMMIVLIMETEIGVVNLQEINMETIVQAAIGELPAIKVVTAADIQKINIQEEAKVKEDAMMMIMIVQKKIAEAEIAEAPGWEEEAVQVLLTGEVDAVIFGNKFRRHINKQ